MAGQAGAQEGAEETTGALPQETSPIGDQASGAGTILVTKRPVEVLAGPSSSASVLYGFPAGRPFRLIGRDAGFAQIQDLKSSATGWIDESALAQPSPGQAASIPSEQALVPGDENAAAASIKQEVGKPTPEQGVVQRRGRTNGRQGPLSGFLGGLFGSR
jgi:hypothetical protein